MGFFKRAKKTISGGARKAKRILLELRDDVLEDLNSTDSSETEFAPQGFRTRLVLHYYNDKLYIVIIYYHV